MKLASGGFQGNETNTVKSGKVFLVLTFSVRGKKKKKIFPTLSSVIASCP